MEGNWFGFYPLALLGIIAAVVVVASIIGFLWYKRKSHITSLTETHGKLLCEFCSPEGINSVLCEVWKGQVKKIEDKSRGTFLVSRFIKSKDIGGEHSIDLYWVLHDHCFPYRYPEGKPYEEQTVVMKTHYLVNDPMPKITYRPDRWNPDKYDRTTAALGKYAQDEKNMQVLVSWLGGMQERIEAFVNYLKRVPLILLGVGINILITIIATIIIVSKLGGIDAIMKFMNLK